MAVDIYQIALNNLSEADRASILEFMEIMKEKSRNFVDSEDKSCLVESVTKATKAANPLQKYDREVGKLLRERDASF